MLLCAALTLVGLVLLRVPFRWLHPDEVLPLEFSALAPDEGHAFLMPLTIAHVSDRDGRSNLHLYEDDMELGPAHALHTSIRQAGAGAYSHWGDWLYFSASDDSDPRTNGRRYEARFPKTVTDAQSLPGAVLVLLAAVVALAAVLARTRALRAAGATAASAWGTWLAAGVFVALGLLVLFAMHRRDVLRDSLEELTASFTEPLVTENAGTAKADDAPGAGRSSPGRDIAPRTLRLLDAPDALDFRATGAAPSARAPVTVSFPKTITLEPGQRMECASAFDMRDDDLAELQLTLRVLQGRSFLLHFTLSTTPEAAAGEGAGDTYQASIEVPVEPSEDWQTLCLGEPLVLSGEQLWSDGSVHVTRLAIGNPDMAPGPVRIEVREAVLSGAGAVYTRTTHGSGRLAVGDDDRNAWWQSVSGGVTLPATELSGRRLRGAVALLDPEGVGGTASYRVETVDDAGRRRVLQAGTLDASQGWLELQADVARDAGPLRLVFGCDELPAGTALAWSALRGVDLSRPAQRAVFVLIDTLRADATGFGGGPSEATPALDALAAQGASFTRCYSQASWTRPSMPSILTGRYVAATGVQLMGQRLPLRYETMAESFATAGFHTLAFLTNTNAGAAAGLDQGFDELVLKFDTSIHDTERFLASVVSPRLAQLPDDDLFVSVHLMEVHEPFGPIDEPPEWRGASGGESLPHDAHYDRPWVAAPTANTRRELYALDVRRTDRALGAFFDRWLPTWESGHGSPVIVAVASDHGEFLGEGGHWGHGWEPMSSAVLHVPLLLRAPGRIPPGVRCTEVVQNVDICETMLALAGVRRRTVDAGVAGRSLLPLLDSGERRGPRTALAGLESGPSRIFTVITAQQELVGETGRLLSPPTDGLQDLLGAHSPPQTSSDASLNIEVDFERAWAAYLLTQRAWRRQLWEGSSAEPMTLEPGALEQLQTLGYFGR